MIGMDAATGKVLGELDHLKQSVREILGTPRGSRVRRRDFGSDLFLLVDKPLNRDTLLDFYSETARALKQWEPRIAVDQVNITSSEIGRAELEVIGTYKPNGQAVKIDGIKVQ